MEWESVQVKATLVGQCRESAVQELLAEEAVSWFVATLNKNIA